MYVKLALRNAKKSIKDYLIYMVTLTLCVGLFYSFMSICSSYYMSKLPVEYDLKQLQLIMRFLVFVITGILIFLIKYVNNYMLRRKQKEFAIQTLLGMEQKNAAFLFFIETIIMGFLSIIIGIILGTFLSQILTSIIMDTYEEEYSMYFSLFPDTVLITIISFCIAFVLIGLLNIRKIRKLKIIDMLRAEKELQNDMRKEFLMPFMVIVAAGVSVYTVYFGNKVFQPFQGNIATKGLSWYDLITIYTNLILPVLFVSIIVGYILLCIVKRKILSFQKLTLILTGITILIIFFTLQVTNGLSTVSNTVVNRYFIFACAYFVILMFELFYSLSTLLQLIKEKSKKWKFKGNTLFLIGQLNGRLSSSSRTMSILSGTIMIAVTVFIIDPVLTGWALGYLEHRAVYDIQITSQGNSKTTIDTSPTGDFTYAEDVLKKWKVELKDAFTAEIYYMNKDDFTTDGLHQPMMVMSLSDYNHLRTMAGYDEISLASNEFTVQWHFGATEKAIDQYLSENQSITVNGNKLIQSSNMRYKEKLGEVIYSYPINGVAIVPDSVCKDLLMSMCNYYGQAAQKMNFKQATELSEAMNKEIAELNGTMSFHTEVRLRTLQRNEGISGALMSKLLFFYGGTVLLIISFTVLSLQQLSDSTEFKQRFKIIKKLGVSETSINRIILGQMGIWFGLPIIFAGIGAFIIGHFYINFTRDLINVFIGMEDLYLAILKTISVMIILFACYFSSTCILFKRNIEL